MKRHSKSEYSVLLMMNWNYLILGIFRCNFIIFGVHSLGSSQNFKKHLISVNNTFKYQFVTGPKGFCLTYKFHFSGNSFPLEIPLIYRWYSGKL